MEVGLLATHRSSRTISAVGRGDVSLASDNRFDTALFHRVVERDGAVHVAVIGHGTRLHPEFLGAFGQWFYLDGAV